MIGWALALGADPLLTGAWRRPATVRDVVPLEAPRSRPRAWDAAVPGHAGPITDLVVHEPSDSLYTTGVDGRVVRWSLASGEQKEVIRVPDEAGGWQPLYAADLSPSGALLAVGGRSVEPWLLDREAGWAIRRLRGLDASVLDLEFQTERRLFVVPYAGGPRVWATRTGTPRRQVQPYYGVGLKALAAERSGAVLACSPDGYLRRHGPGGRLLQRQPLESGACSRVSVSPSGRWALVSYEPGQADLRPLPSLRGGGSLNLGPHGGLAAWLSDGHLLTLRRASDALDSTELDPHRMEIVIENPDGRWSRQDDLTARFVAHRLVDVLGLSDGGWVGATQDYLVRFDRHGRERWRGHPGVPWRAPSRGTVHEAPAGPPPTPAGQIRVGQRAETVELRVGTHGRVLRFTVSAPPPAGTGLLVDGWSLPVPVGVPRWRPDGALFAGASPEGGWVVASMADGTLRWYREQVERLALYVDPASTRWVAWTPEGYHVHATGADDLLGAWVRGTDRWGDAWIAANEWARDLLRPDLFAGGWEALGGSGRAPPLAAPSLRTVGPAGWRVVGAGQVETVVEVQPPSSLLEVYVDGRRVTPEVTMLAPGRVRLRVNASAGRRSLHVRAVGSAGVSSGSTTVLDVPGVIAKPAVRMLAVGVDSFPARSELARLRFAAKDAGDVASAVGRYWMEADAEPVVLLDTEATPARVEEALARLADASKPGDLTVVFLATHGTVDPEGRFQLALRTDAAVGAGVAWMEGTRLVRLARSVQGRVLLLLDACHAGAAQVAGATVATGWVQMEQSVADPGAGVALLAATGSRGVAWESPTWRNGAFTQALLDSLGQPVPPASLSSFHAEVTRRLLALSGTNQVPVLLKGPAFPDFSLGRAAATAPLPR